MSFNTTLEVNPDITMLGHPSMFQTPQLNVLLDDNIDKAKSIDPMSMWQNKVSVPAAGSYNMQSQYTVPFDPSDPPFSRPEREKMMRSFRPIIGKDFNNREPTLLFCLFFSMDNCATLQKMIRFSVNKWSGYHVGEQSMLELCRIMENVFVGKAMHIDEFNAPSKMVLKHLRNEVGRLNELVINEVVPIVINNLEQHMEYLKRVDNPVSATSLQRPLDTKITGTMSYRSPTDILS